jgi:hypothetical protein
MKWERGSEWLAVVRIYLTPAEAKLLAAAIRKGQNNVADTIKEICK